MQSNQQKYTKPFIVLAILLLVIFCGLQLYQSLQFHVVRTNPSMGSIPTSAPYIQFYFNQPVTNSGLSISANPAIFGKYKLDNKVLTLPVIATNFQVGRVYTITLESIRSTSGKYISNKTFRFTAQTIAFQKLPKDIQAAILANQANQPITRDSYAYTGTDTFIDQGMSVTELADLKQGIFSYIQTNKKSVREISISNIAIKPYDPNGSSAITTATFTLSFDAIQTFSAKFEYQYLTKGQLYLYDPASGAQVYDSGLIDLSQSSS